MTIFDKAVELLEGGKSFAFATIVTQDGSTPRTSGSKMIITEDDTFFTIGGGGFEGDAINRARETVMKEKMPLMHFYSLRGDEAATTDFICGGDIEVLIDYIDAKDENNLTVFKAAAEAFESGVLAWLVTILDSSKDGKIKRQFGLSHSKKGLIGALEDTETVNLSLLSSPLHTSIHGEDNNKIRYILDPVHIGGTCYIFGGGHVSYALANVLKNLEFHIVIIDDREEYANKERFPFCDTMVIPNYKELDVIKPNQDSYLLIITRGHKFDREVLEWAIKQDAYYIGMIGSKTKRDTIYNVLMQEGTPKETLEKVFSPIGLQIGAQTPEEIAISIAGELISERAKKFK